MIAAVSATMPYQNEQFLLSSISYISSGAIDKIHGGYCYQMCTALSEPFDCRIGNADLKSTWGFIANQNMVQNFASPGSMLLIHFIDAESRWGKVIKALLKGGNFIETKSFAKKEEGRLVLPQKQAEMTNEEIVICIAGFLESLFSPDILAVSEIGDLRIELVMQYVKRNLDKKITLEAAAEHIHLSSERLRHLFVEQTGVPFSQYVLWKRMRAVIVSVGKDSLPVSKVCTRFGFTDYSHFSRIFKRSFGVSPNILFRYCRVLPGVIEHK